MGSTPQNTRKNIFITTPNRIYHVFVIQTRSPKVRGGRESRVKNVRGKETAGKL